MLYLNKENGESLNSFEFGHSTTVESRYRI